MHGGLGAAAPWVVRVWEHGGCALHAVGEAAEGLSGPLTWQPNGRHLYAAACSEGRQRVLLYERNGLRHGGFEVPGTRGGAPCHAYL